MLKKSHNNLFRILFLFLLIGITSCKTVDVVLNPNDYKKEYNQPKRLIYDTVQVKVSKSDYTLEPIAGELPTKQFTFSKIGEQINFKKGEPIEIIFDKIDFSRAAIQVITNEKKESVTMKLSDKLYDEIKFENQCQCIEIRNVSQLPPIELNPNLDPHQIILTPIYNNCPDCILIGYQIRYGDQQLAGCWNEAKEIYSRFKCCKEAGLDVIREPDDNTFNEMFNIKK